MLESSNRALKGNTTHLTESTPTVQSSASLFSREGASWHITLLIQEEQPIPLRLSVKGRAILGRPDEADGFTPEIDVTPFNGRDKGVSRRHAEFITIEGQLYVRDLGSTNGTRLNSQLLQPHRAYCLREGDLLQCGNLYMLIKLS